MLLTYFLNDFEIVPVAPIITGITVVVVIIIIIIIIIINCRAGQATHDIMAHVHCVLDN